MRNVRTCSGRTTVGLPRVKQHADDSGGGSCAGADGRAFTHIVSSRRSGADDRANTSGGADADGVTTFRSGTVAADQFGFARGPDCRQPATDR